MLSLERVFSWQEIVESRGLRLFGSVLALLHIATFVFWREALLQRLGSSLDVICWPFFPGCEVTRLIPVEVWRGFFVFYGLLAVATTLFFWSGRARLGLKSLVGLVILKTIFQIADYRGMGNYHFMMTLATVVFLFLPEKIKTLRVLVVYFYLASGLLKLNVEWLSGAPMEGGPSFFSSLEALLLGASAVFFLEIFGPWFLLAQRSWIRWTALLSFVVFHGISVFWVGFYFPVIMLGLLAIFPLTWFELPASGILERASWPHSRWSVIFLIVLVVLQVQPLLAQGDPGLDARLRLLSLNMYEVRPQCEQRILIRYRDQTIEYAPSFYPHPRLQCNTLFFLSEMKRICAIESRRPDFLEMAAVMVTKRLNDFHYQTVIQEPHFCARGEP